MTANERSIKGDFIGFTLGNIHSSELGLVRVSEGGRYNEDLLPPLQDKKGQVSGRDGEVYFGSQYMTKPIKVPVAFDNMSEKSFADLRRLISSKTPQFLWFDETPYKQWLVKSAAAQSFKWLCFDEYRNGQKQRIYKGEGVLEFNCFTPYAVSRVVYLDDTVDEVLLKNEKGRLVFTSLIGTNKPKVEDFYNFEEWCEGSRLKYRHDILNTNDAYNGTEIEYEKYYEDFRIYDYPRKGVFLYNAGDIPLKPKITCQIPNDYPVTNDLLFRLYAFNNSPKDEMNDEDFREIGEMIISKDMILQHRRKFSDDLYIVIDSKLKMIKGAQSENQLNGIIYNKYHKSGDYLEIPVSNEDIYFIEITEVQEKVNEDEVNSNNNENVEIIENENEGNTGNEEENTDQGMIKILSINYTHQYY